MMGHVIGMLIGAAIGCATVGALVCIAGAFRRTWLNEFDRGWYVGPLVYMAASTVFALAAWALAVSLPEVPA